MKRKEKIINFMWVITCLICLVIFAAPVLVAFTNSLRGMDEGAVVWFPDELHWENYKYAVTLIPFFRYMMSSFIIVLIVIFFGMTTDFLYGYAFARLNAKFRYFFWMIVMAQMMIPGSAITIPQYITFKNLGVKDTYWIWILCGFAGNAYTIFRYKQFIENVPKDLEDAAFIDGCGFFGIVRHIYYPMCKNVLAISFFSHFMAGWGDYMTAFMYLTEKKYPLAIALFNSSYVLPWDTTASTQPIKLAAGLLFAGVSIIVFFFCQRQLQAGITAGAVKG